MWHDLTKNSKDLPSKPALFLVRFEDGSMGLQEFSTYTKHFLGSRKPIAWTDRFQEPDSSCHACGKAHWKDLFGVMCYTCDTAYCTAPDPDDPFA